MIDMNAMFFAMPFALFPALAERYGGTEVVGLLWAAPGVGAIVAMLTSGWARRVHHNGARDRVRGRRAGACAASRCSGWRTRCGSRWCSSRSPGAADAISRHLPRRAVERDDPGPRCAGASPGVEMISWSSGPLLGNARAGRGGLAVRAAARRS